MSIEESTLERNGYNIEERREESVVATKGDKKFLIKKVDLNQTPNVDPALISEITILKEMDHPHIVSSKNSFRVEDENSYYIVMDYCQGGNLAAKIRERNGEDEFEVLSWIAEICVALGTIHEKGIPHKNLMPENIFLTEFGLVCLGDFGKVHENSRNTQSNKESVKIKCLAPEVLREGTNDAKSDIWSVGCILYELLTGTAVFSAETTIRLIPKIISGAYTPLPEHFSLELRQLLKDILNKDPQSRPTAADILKRPIMRSCLKQKRLQQSKRTVEEIKTQLKTLRDLADGLERVHEGATIGSLTGGVIRALGGITSIVGLILAPVTLGASVIVSGVGLGVGVVGGVTAGASKITNMVNQSTYRKDIQSTIKEVEQKMKTVCKLIESPEENISESLSMLSLENRDEANLQPVKQQDEATLLAIQAKKVLNGIARLFMTETETETVTEIATEIATETATETVTETATEIVTEIVTETATETATVIATETATATVIVTETATEIATETVTETAKVIASETAQLVEVATGVLSGLFLAVNMFFIAKDAREIHHIKQAREIEGQRAQVLENEASDSGPTSDQDILLPNTPEIRSEIMNFVISIRKKAEELQEILDIIEYSINVNQ